MLAMWRRLGSQRQRWYSTWKRWFTASGNQNEAYQIGQQLHGFVVQHVVPVPELQLTAVGLEHVATGAQHLHVDRKDTNNVFCVAFRTIPKDDTGVSHILEHTVLCGSAKYPCRDPFFKMLNRSLATFMNAFTSSDFTMYPFSSQNMQDFRNLMSVYTDAVFFPNLMELDFRQEGWRLEHQDIQNRASPVLFKGVVFNEMKGALSSGESLFEMHLQRKLYPSHTYAYAFGGDPLSIVDLTWEQLKEFHARHYHPSNARFYTYGDMPLASHLEQIDREILQQFSKDKPAPAVPLEKRWQKPQQYLVDCPPDPMAPVSGKQTTMAISFLLGSILDPQESLVMDLLCRMLSDGQASPFYQSLIESGVGSNFSPGTGYQGHLKEASFSIGLQGISGSDISTVKEIIWKTFSDISENGFPPERVHSILHQYELNMRHQRSTFGLDLIASLMPVWNHDGDIVQMLKFGKRLEELKANLEAQPTMLTDRVRKYFLENQHHLTLIMAPKDDFDDATQKAEKDKLATYVASMTEKERKVVYQQGLELNAKQDSLEDAEVLPTLQISDVNTQGDFPMIEHLQEAGVTVQFAEQPTNGVTYFKAVSSITSIPQDIIAYVPLFCSLITNLGAGDLNHRDFSQECDLHTGGLSVSPHLCQHHTVLSSYEQGVLLSSHCLDRNVPYMFSLWQTLMTAPRIDDLDLLEALVKMAASNLSAHIVDAGHQYAMTSSSASLTPSSHLSEVFTGLTQAEFLKKVAKEDMSSVAEKLRIIAAHVFDSSQLRCSINATHECTDKTMRSLEALVHCLPGSPRDLPSLVEDFAFYPSSMKQHHVLPFPVNFVSMSMLTVPYAHKDAPSLRVLARLMTNRFLHRQIREKGGAYGGGARYGSGIFSFYSYRDPNGLATVDQFLKSVQWVCSGDFTQQDIDEAKLAVFAQVDSPVSPGAKGSSQFLSNITADLQQAHRDGIFAVGKDSLVDVAKSYLNSSDATVSVSLIGAEEKVPDGEGWIKHRVSI